MVLCKAHVLIDKKIDLEIVLEYFKSGRTNAWEVSAFSYQRLFYKRTVASRGLYLFSNHEK